MLTENSRRDESFLHALKQSAGVVTVDEQVHEVLGEDKTVDSGGDGT
jgi:hypothetical protein